MSYVILSNKLYSSTTIQFNANTDLIIAGDSASSNIAIGNEQITGVYITQINWGCDPNAHIQIWRGLELIGVYDSTSYVDYAGNGMVLNNKLERNMSVKFVGGSGYCVMELQKVLNQDMNYSAYPNALVELDFTREYYRVLGKRYPTFSSIPGATVTGGGGFATATTVDSRVIGPFSPNTLPVTNAGAEIWEARTNALRNAIFGGASLGVVGSGGAMPTNMSLSSSTSQMTITLSETGVESGRPFIELRLQSASAPTSLGLRFETASGVPASAGQVWSAQNGVKFVGGSLSGVGVCYPQIETFGGSSSKPGGSVTLSPQLQNLFATHTMPVGCTNLRSQLIFTMTPGAAVDFTVRVYAPQLELGSFPTPYIPTTTAAATRTALNASITGLASILTPPFTMYAEAYLPAIDGVDRYLLRAGDGAGNNQFNLRRTASNVGFVQSTAGGVSGPTASFSGKTGARLLKMAVRSRSTSYMAACDGSLSTEQSFTPSSFDRLNLGQNINGASVLNGQIRRVLILPDMSDAQLQALTA